MKSIEQRNKTLFKAFHENIEAQTKAKFYELLVNSDVPLASDYMQLGSQEHRSQLEGSLTELNKYRNQSKWIHVPSLDIDHASEDCYIVRSVVDYMYDNMGKSVEEINEYFAGKSRGVLNQDYYTNFRPLLIKLKLETMGMVLNADQLQNRLKMTKLRRKMAHDYRGHTPEYVKSCDREYEAYYLVKVFMESMDIDKIDLLAFFNANSLGLYAELTRTPKTGKLEGVTFKPITPHELEYKEIIE